MKSYLPLQSGLGGSCYSFCYNCMSLAAVAELQACCMLGQQPSWYGFLRTAPFAPSPPPNTLLGTELCLP